MVGSLLTFLLILYQPWHPWRTNVASKMRLEVRAGVEDFSCDGQWDCSLCLVQPSQRTLLDRVSS